MARAPLFVALLNLAGVASAWRSKSLFLEAHDSNPQQYLIASTPSTAKIHYITIPSGGIRDSDSKVKVEPLITSGLSEPQGIAVDTKGKRLIVADPSLGQILSYDLHVNDAKDLSAKDKKVLVKDTEARWVAVDSAGTVFFTDESTNQILALVSSPNGTNSSAMANTTETKVSVLYDGDQDGESLVSNPGGISVDDFHVYWVNKNLASTVGSVVVAPARPEEDATLPRALSSNTDKSYGVCLSRGNLYYTQPEQSLYGVPSAGGDVQLINDRLTNPRGCAFDSEGTVYVADRGLNSIFSFAGGMQPMTSATLRKDIALEDAYSLAVYTATTTCVWRFLFWRECS